MYTVQYKYMKDYRYYPEHEGVYPVVEMNLQANGKRIELPAIVDTGAQYTLVSPEYAQALELDLYSGKTKVFTTATGQEFKAYGHRIQIRILGENLDSQIFFPETKLHRCLLGRDLLETMQIGVKESLSTLYLF